MMQVLTGARVFDGTRLRDGMAVCIDGTRIAALIPEAEAPAPTTRLNGGILAPAFIDLQVNGGGGLAIGPDTDLDAIRAICATHIALGTGGLLPTLITDTPEVTARVIAAAIAAERAGVDGFLGLHLEGPHLDPRRKGAHDARLIRPMQPADLSMLLEAKSGLRHLMVTLAPEAATSDQITSLARAGILVSLGHTDCAHPTAKAAIAAGAASATHLFNAMSQLGSREPGLVGAVLGSDLPCGVIADGIHIAPETLRIALAAKPRGAFLVTDAMAFAGTALTEMHLNGRLIRRANGRLVLEDGTLAGADLAMPQALRTLTGPVRLPLPRALAMATSIPARVIKAFGHGRIGKGRFAHLVHLDEGLAVQAVWHAGLVVGSA
jgi:N-acetylglucosamine-6-phosphate deacetylase